MKLRNSTVINHSRFIGLTIKLASITMLLLVLAFPQLGFAQASGASLTGQVYDSTGAIIPNASVTLANTETNLSQVVKTNEVGGYSIAPILPGTYVLTVSAKGFSTYSQRGIVLTVGLAAAQNVTLRAGAETETVQVDANIQLIQTTTATIGFAVTKEAITQLPLNGRDPQSLVFLAPGVTNGTAIGVALNQGEVTFPQETGASSGVGGGRADSTYYLLDGVPNQDNYVGLAAPFPNSDATQEFRVNTSNNNARYGFSPGAVVTIATKSGTNAFHGAAWEFVRNKSLNASNWFSHAVDPLHQNQFGAALGGPVLKNKLFFFANYQATRSSTASRSSFAQSYTPAMLQGDFSGLPEALNAPFTTIDGKPNQINPALLNPIAVQIAQNALPVGKNDNNIYGGVYYSSGKVINSYDEGTGRIDYSISPSQQLFARSYVNYLRVPADGTKGNILSYGPLTKLEDYNGAVGHTWTITPKLVNVATVFLLQLDDFFGGGALQANGQPFCWSSYSPNIKDPPGPCSFEGFSVTNSFSSPYLEPCGVNRATYGLYDNFSASLGRHVFDFGVNLQHQFNAETCNYPSNPILSFNGQYTNNGIADFLLGDLQSFFQGAGEVGSQAGWQPGFYAQDQFRLKNNITIEAGLRWDPNIPLTISGGRGAAFVPGQQSKVYPNAPAGLVFPGDSGIGPGIMRTTYGYWEPRLGIAWQPHSLPHTSIHAGLGLYSAPVITSFYNHVNDNSPFSPTFTLNGTESTPLSLSNPWSGFAGTGGVSAFPPFASSAYRPPASATFTNGLSIPATFDPGFKNGMTQAWNLAVEQQLGENMMVRLAYVGSLSYHQSILRDSNPGIFATGGTRSEHPNFGQILEDFSIGTASYHSLQATVERHMSHGLQFQSNFTWSKLIDIADSANISFGAQGLADPFDIRFSRGVSSANVPFVWVSNLIYATPQLTGHPKVLQETLGGWEFSVINTAQSGTPFTVTAGFGNNNSGSLQYSDRADRVAGQSLKARQGGRSHWLNNYFNINAFTVNAPGTFGNSGKNLMTGPPTNFMDAGLSKNWSIEGKFKIQFRWEMFNALNHPNFAAPRAQNQIGSGGSNNGGSEGVITSLGFEPPRVMQGALKLTF